MTTQTLTTFILLFVNVNELYVNSATIPMILCYVQTEVKSVCFESVWLVLWFECRVVGVEMWSLWCCGGIIRTKTITWEDLYTYQTYHILYINIQYSYGLGWSLCIILVSATGFA